MPMTYHWSIAREQRAPKTFAALSAVIKRTDKLRKSREAGLNEERLNKYNIQLTVSEWQWPWYQQPWAEHPLGSVQRKHNGGEIACPETEYSTCTSQQPTAALILKIQINCKKDQSTKQSVCSFSDKLSKHLRTLISAFQIPMSLGEHTTCTYNSYFQE